MHFFTWVRVTSCCFLALSATCDDGGLPAAQCSLHKSAPGGLAPKVVQATVVQGNYPGRAHIQMGQPVGAPASRAKPCRHSYTALIIVDPYMDIATT